MLPCPRREMPWRDNQATVGLTSRPSTAMSAKVKLEVIEECIDRYRFGKDLSATAITACEEKSSLNS